MPYQMRLGDLYSDLAANGGGAVLQQGATQGSITPAMMHFAIPDAVRSQLAQAVASTMPAADSSRCDCLLSAIPGLASQPDQLAAGRQLCMQDPSAFEAQLRTAGWNPVCDAGGAGTSSGSSGTSDTSGGGAPAGFLSTTGGKVAIGVGVLAVIGIGVAVARRRKGH